MDRRNFIRISALGAVISGTGIASCNFSASVSAGDDATDITVVGGTPGGIMAAIAAARAGARVTLTEYHGHIGGMSTSGLGKSDIENKDAIAGLFKEFVQRVRKYYVDKYGEGSKNVILCKDGYYYEPSVAEHIFNEMVNEEKNIRVLLNYQIEGVEMESDRIVAAVFKDRKTGEMKTVRAKVFVDATYEGDVYALAGAAYRLGRESRDEFGEAHAGRIFFDYNEKVFLEGSTGEGDKRLPAYTYRLCLTDVPENSYVLTEPPPGYNRENYVKYFDDLKEGRLSAPKTYNPAHGFYAAHFDTMVRVFSFSEIPNGKYDVNINPRPLGFPFVGENYAYPEASWEEREKIFQRHRELTLGLIYFAQNDPEVPEAHRKLARQYHLPLDEFKDNEHFPWQFYIREARRLKGKYTLTENDITIKGDAKRTTIFDDTIITGEFPIDSFPVSKEPSADRKVLEGYIGMLEISPYQIPYRILIPEKIKGLIVPVAASTTHVAFSTVRMEPQWMSIGQVAGIAAQMAIQMQVDVADVPINLLQRELIGRGQILTYFNDLERDDKAFQAAQFWGTKGFFDSYDARVREPLTQADLKSWIGKFRSLAGLPASNLPGSGTGSVSIADFAAIVQSLAESQASVAQSEDAIAWLYETRPDSSPVLRGEACLALYELFFQKHQREAVVN